MLDSNFYPNGTLRSFENHIEIHEKANNYTGIAKKNEKMPKFNKSLPYAINDKSPKMEKPFWLDAYCPEVIRQPYDEHNNLNYNTLRHVQNLPVQVGSRLVPYNELVPLRFGR